MNEYTATARIAAAGLAAMSRDDAIVAACRGSGNPALLAWLAEAAPLRSGDLVLDVGGGLGGPAAWFADRYGCDVVVAEPVAEAVQIAAAIFDRPAVRPGSSLFRARGELHGLSHRRGGSSMPARRYRRSLAAVSADCAIARGRRTRR